MLNHLHFHDPFMLLVSWWRLSRRDLFVSILNILYIFIYTSTVNFNIHAHTNIVKTSVKNYNRWNKFICRCEPYIAVGKPCTQKGQCVPQAECSAGSGAAWGSCMCSPGYYSAGEFGSVFGVSACLDVWLLMEWFVVVEVFAVVKQCEDYPRFTLLSNHR